MSSSRPESSALVTPVATPAPAGASPVAQAERVVREVVERFGADRLALAASWQKETAVLVDLMRRFAPEGRIFTLDTGVLFPQSYAVWRKVEERYGIKVEAWKGEWVDGLWEVDPDRCCNLRKVIPLQQALADADCWLTGLRRDQSPERADTPELSWDDRHGLHKAAPLATWTDKDVWTYIFEHDLPYNELHDQGYASIGCTHCTLAGAGREGRWAGTAKSECGLHA